MYVETDWHPSARIVFPATGGQLKLLQQTSLPKTIIKAAMERSLFDIAFKTGYETMPSRPAFVSGLLRRVALKHGDTAEHIGRRAKKDLLFATRLTPMVSLVLLVNNTLTNQDMYTWR